MNGTLWRGMKVVAVLHDRGGSIGAAIRVLSIDNADEYEIDLGDVTKQVNKIVDKIKDNRRIRGVT